MNKVITLKPRMSEKTYALSTQGLYVFDIEPNVNKHEVALAVSKTYGVTVTQVRIVSIKGKTKRTYRNRRFTEGSRNDIKKAYVTLKAGDAIPIFASVQDTEEPAKKDDKKSKKEEK